MKKILSFILAILLLTALAPALFAESAATEEYNILACSDFQAPSGNTEGVKNVTAILSTMENAGLKKADALFVCGDYDYEYTDTKQGITYLKNATASFLNNDAQKVFVQGNHDSANSAVGTNGLAESGDNDPAHNGYGVFVINEEDYMWYNDDKTTVTRTAQNLIDYLNEKLAEDYDRPIFILSHLALNYSMRTYNDGDGKYAYMLFDAINQAGAQGLNIFFLYGHNHSNGWDDYLGGSQVYLTHGDKMIVAHGNTNVPPAETMHFTYFNAGYIGYYTKVNEQADTLTMTYITIKDNNVTLSRYSKDGICDLKVKGVRNDYKNETKYEPNEKVYTSPQTVTLNTVSDRTPVEDIIKTDKTLPIYKLVESIDELKDQGSYLFYHTASPNGVMTTEEVTKANSSGSERIGFDFVESTDFGSKLAYSSIENALFTFVKDGDDWIITVDGLEIGLESTSNKGIAANLVTNGVTFTITEEDGEFIFEAENYYLNYNGRGLINFYRDNPATFYLYEAVGYGVTANNGIATKDGESISYAKPGDTFTVKPQNAPNGYVFDKWEVTAGDVTLADPTAAEQTVTMPNGALTLKAVYKKAPANEPTNDPTNDPTDTENNTVVIVIVVVSSVLVLASAATLFIVFKKRSK